MKLIQLTRGMFAQIDDEDFDRVMAQGRWQAVVGYNTWYASTSFKIPGTRKNRKVLLHRFIMGCEEGDGQRVDHKDENGLNCQKENLRIASATLNSFNRKELLANNTSGVEGVYWSKQKQKWVGEIIWYGKKIYCGASKDLAIAGQMRQAMKDKLMEGVELDEKIASLDLTSEITLDDLTGV